MTLSESVLTLIFVFCLSCGKKNNVDTLDSEGENNTERNEPSDQGNNSQFYLIVAKDGSGDYTTVQEAINAVQSGNINDTASIFIKEGIYKELITVPKSKTFVRLVGENVDKVILTFDNFASKINPKNNEEYGTSGSASFFVRGKDFKAENITFENSSGPVGQALAIYIGADKSSFLNCKFLGFQDTIYAGGLEDGVQARAYFNKCYIEGATDFIFGESVAVFDNCEIFCSKGGYITAASTPKGAYYGFVFLNCNITGTADKGSVILGRTWRPYAKTVFINCHLNDIVSPIGWSDWGDPTNRTTAYYAEYNNSGDGARIDGRASWAYQLTREQAGYYNLGNLFGDWVP